MNTLIKSVGIARSWKGLLAGAVVVVGIGGCIAVVQPGQPMTFQAPSLSLQIPGVTAEPAPAPAPEQAPEAAPQVQNPATNPNVATLDPLVAPIALYPDPILAVVLPAATYPTDQLQTASDWDRANPQADAAAIDGQQWAPEVRAVAHYPDALTVLVADPQWTQSLGSAYSDEQTDVMAAIQDMRGQATVQGNLASTPQQAVVNQGGTIAIVPANPQVIYVPTYDPVVVYTAPVTISFGTPLVVGPWFVNGFDWEGGDVYVGDWYGPYYYHDGNWGWDHAWRASHYRNFRHWQHDARFGHAAHVDRAHYALARGVEAHKTELRRALQASRAQRSSRVEQSAKSAGRTVGSNNGKNPKTGGNHPGNPGGPKPAPQAAPAPAPKKK